MASSVIRATWFGFPGGGKASGIQTAGVGANAAAVVTIPFNEALRAGPAFAQFTATVAGSARGVTAASVSGKNLSVTLASAPIAGQAVVIMYAPGGTPATRLADADGEEHPAGTLTTFTAA